MPDRPEEVPASGNAPRADGTYCRSGTLLGSCLAADTGFSLIPDIIGFSLVNSESPANPMNVFITSLRQMRQSFVPSTAAVASPVNRAVQPTPFSALPTSRYLRSVENLVLLSVAGYFGWAVLAVAFS